MKSNKITDLSRRERQIMDVIYRNGKATASEVKDLLPDPPGYSSVRALLRILEEKGLLKHQNKGARYIYSPVINREKAKNSALKHLMTTFFENSTERVVSTLLDISSSKLTKQELDRMSELIEKAKKEENNND